MKSPAKLFAPITAVFLFVVSFAFAQNINPQVKQVQTTGGQSAVELPSEKHLRNVRQLTDGGENAEAYFSGDGRQLIFQSKRDGRATRFTR
ncbi:MAG TPA: hypothetical protein VHU19_06330 [Pyrinomonadaceae bacterium]|jgi:Tol biopolymer transport system component|nr:hypothetical protein [Pyrinomonadaceae bacterium]